MLAGLAAQAKLNALLLLPSVFLYLLLSPTARERWLRRPEPYLAGRIALADARAVSLVEPHASERFLDSRSRDEFTRLGP